MKPKFVTFTGIDERTDPERLISLSAAYPVEWGILFSRANQGNAERYPGLMEVGRILDYCADKGVQFSAHICGVYSRQIMTPRDATDPVPWELTDLAAELEGHFRRTQINVADGETLVAERDVRPDLGAAWARAIGAERAIIQCRGNFPDDDRVDWLYDRSGGAGREPSSWYAGAAQSRAFCGYAGGIGAHNVERVLSLIRDTHPADRPYWIDMEGQVRTDEWLDLDLCEAVLKTVYG